MEQLIETWNQAVIDPAGMDKSYRSEDLVPTIARLEKNQQKLLRTKTVTAVIALLALLIVFMNKMSFTLTSILGIGIFVFSVLTVIILLNRLRFRITPEERSLSTLQLAAVSERKIRTERKVFTRYLPLFLLVALAGFNLMYVDFFSGEETATRVQYHLIMTGSLIVAFIVGLTVRIRRFHRQFLPLLRRIRQFKKESGE